MLPEDREAHHFNKVSETLDMSRVQLAAYLDASEAALRQAMVTAAGAAARDKVPHLRHESVSGVPQHGHDVTRCSSSRTTRASTSSRSGGRRCPKELAEDPSLEMGLFRSPGWPYGAFPRGFAAKHAGEYRVRFSARAVLQHPGFQVSDAKQAVPMTFRSRRPTNHDIAEDVKSVGGILEIQPGVHVYETTVPLIAGQTVEYGLLGLPVPQVDAEGKTGSYRYPPLPPDGQPGVAFQWIEIEGPIPPPTWPPASHRVLFDDLGVSPAPAQPKQEASRLLRRFHAVWRRAARCRRRRCGNSSNWCLRAWIATSPFAEAMLAGYQAFLCSDLFLYLREPNDNFAVADRLSHFLTNTRPDAQLLELAASSDPAALRRETDRLIDGAGFERFVKNFAGYWLESPPSPPR